MSSRFFGFDHIDTRVRSLNGVERFYDQLMPELGLSRKRFAHVDAQGDWHEVSDERPCNAVEYHEHPSPGQTAFFIGFIEDREMVPTLTRIAFRVGSPAELNRWHELLESIGAVHVERSASEDYPALFFEDPSGTKLEICARLPAQAD